MNAAAQRCAPESLLNWMERVIRMRKEVPEIGWGDFTALETGDTGILALRYDWRNNSVLCLHNLSPEPKEITFATGLDGDGRNLIDLLTGQRSLANADGCHRVLMEGYGYRWFRVGGWITCCGGRRSDPRLHSPVLPPSASFRGREAEPGIQSRGWLRIERPVSRFILSQPSVWIPGSAFAAPE